MVIETSDRGQPVTSLTDDLQPPGRLPLETVDRGTSLTDQVYARLRRGLLIGVWHPGQKITARKIARELGVSLTPAREAMMRLANESALDVSETRTYSAVSLTLEQYREIARIRTALEPLATQIATPLMDAPQIAELTRINEALKETIRQERFNEALQLDSEFHLTIYDRAASPTLLGMIDSLWLRAGPTRNRLSHSYRKRLVGYENHKKIIDALRGNDSQAAHDAMMWDLKAGAETVMSVLAATETTGGELT